MKYVIDTTAGHEQQCLKRCEQYIDVSSYSQVLILQFISQKHFKKEWYDMKKGFFGVIYFDMYPESRTHIISAAASDFT